MHDLTFDEAYHRDFAEAEARRAWEQTEIGKAVRAILDTFTERRKAIDDGEFARPDWEPGHPSDD